MFKQKTTWAGLAALFSSIGYAIATKDIGSGITGVVSGLGLIFASDSAPASR